MLVLMLPNRLPQSNVRISRPLALQLSWRGTQPLSSTQNSPALVLPEARLVGVLVITASWNIMSVIIVVAAKWKPWLMFPIRPQYSRL